VDNTSYVVHTNRGIPTSGCRAKALPHARAAQRATYLRDRLDRHALPDRERWPAQKNSLARDWMGDLSSTLLYVSLSSHPCCSWSLIFGHIV